MKYDEKAKQKEIYYKEQQERITLYLKYNTKKPNTIKSVHFTSLEQGPMGDAVIEGYINNNKEDEFVAFASPENNYQFGVEADLQQTLKYLNCLNRLMNLDPQMKSKKI